MLVTKSRGNRGTPGSGSWQEGQQLETSTGLSAGGMETAVLCPFTQLMAFSSINL